MHYPHNALSLACPSPQAQEVEEMTAADEANREAVFQVCGVRHGVLGVLHRVLGVPHRAPGVPHRVLGSLHRVLGSLHRVLGVLHTREVKRGRVVEAK